MNCTAAAAAVAGLWILPWLQANRKGETVKLLLYYQQGFDGQHPRCILLIV